jgi:putative oxidoreductase
MNSDRVITVLRILFGVHFLWNGLNYIFGFMEIPRPPGEMANTLVDTMNASGIFWFAKGTEVVSGLLLIAGQWVPLALLLAFPISVVIAYVDIVLTERPLYAVVGLINLLWNGGLLLAYLKYYRPFLVRSSTPGMR